MKRNRALSPVVVVLLSSFAVSAQEFQPVRPGIEHLKISRTQKTAEGANEPLAINLLRIDLGLTDVRIIHALDEAIGQETISSMAARYKAAAGVNAGFFATTGTYRGDNVGALIIDGTWLSEPTQGRAAVGFVRRGDRTEIIFGYLKFDGLLTVAHGLTYRVSGINRARGKDELIVYMPAFHRTTLTPPDGMEVLVRRGRVTRWRDQSGSSRIPEDGFVISAVGKARDWVRQYLTVGARVNFQAKLVSEEYGTREAWDRACCVVAGGPMIVREGRVEITNDREGIGQGFVTDRHPRTAIARLKDGRLLLAVIDGRQPGYSAGVALTQLAELLLEFGAVEALNLDGGGSSAMVVGGQLVNKPSDAAGERAVSDAILIFERPGGRKGSRGLKPRR